MLSRDEFANSSSRTRHVTRSRCLDIEGAMSRCLRAAALAFALLGCTSQEPLPVVDHVDLSRFQGRWYEVAKLPRPLQARCTATTASYELASKGELLVKHECREGGLD